MSVQIYNCVLAFVLAGLTGVMACPNNWVTFNGFCYSFVNTKLSWFHASKACRDQNARLVDIGSKAEEDYLRGTIKQLHAHDNPQNIGYWAGGNDLDVEGQWVWGYPSDNPMTYTDWFPGEPNNSWGSDRREENCVVLWGHDSHDYQWNDQPCDFQDYYICKTEDGTDVLG